MESKIYRAVSVRDRLPDKSGYYLTNHGKRHFYTDHKLWQHNYDDKSPVDWYLEEITLPTEEEMFNHAMVVESKEDEELDAFRDGASFILNHIKGGGEHGVQHI